MTNKASGENGKPPRSVRLLDRLMIALVVLFVLFVIYLSFQPFLIEQRVEYGMDQAQVQSVVEGMPLGEDSLQGLCSAGLERLCDEARAAGAGRLSAWSLGIDTFLLVGFDDNSRVVFCGTGDS